MGRGWGFFGGGKWSSYGEYFRDKDKKTHRQFRASLQNHRRDQQQQLPSPSSSGLCCQEGQGEKERRCLPGITPYPSHCLPQETDVFSGRRTEITHSLPTPTKSSVDTLCSSSSLSSSSDASVDRIPGLHSSSSSSTSSSLTSSHTHVRDEGGYGRTAVAQRVRDILLSIHEGHIHNHGGTDKGANPSFKAPYNHNRSLFKNCVFYVDGDTLGIDDVCFKKLLLFFGGRICMLFGKGCTHVIAENLALGNQRWRQLRYVFLSCVYYCGRNAQCCVASHLRRMPRVAVIHLAARIV